MWATMMLAARSAIASANISRGWASRESSVPIVIIRCEMRRWPPSKVRQTRCSCCFARISLNRSMTSWILLSGSVSRIKCRFASSNAARILEARAALTPFMEVRSSRLKVLVPRLNCFWICLAMLETSVFRLPLPMMTSSNSKSESAWAPLVRNFSRGRSAAGICCILLALCTRIV